MNKTYVGGVECRDDRRITVSVGQTLKLFSGYTGKQIGVVLVKRVCKNYCEVGNTSMWVRDVKFRTSGRLCGIRIIGGIAEQLNEYITGE